MSHFFAELVGTFFLIFIGIGSCLFLSLKRTNKKVNFYFIGFNWCVAIFIANCFGILLGSNKFNPIFSMLAWQTREISGELLLVECVAQVIGAFFASMIIYTIFKSQLNLNMNYLSSFAPIPSHANNFRNSFYEFLGTFTIVFLSFLLAAVMTNKILSALLISVIIGILIRFIAPITGASFNPTRDLIPRLFYTFVSGKTSLTEQKQIWVTTLVPFVGGAVGYLFAKIFLEN